MIVEGRSEAAPTHGRVLGERLAFEITSKYGGAGYSRQPDSWDSYGLRLFTAVKAMAWSNFPTDVTRFLFWQNFLVEDVLACLSLSWVG